MSNLPARFTIERTTTPNSAYRFLGQTGTGHLAWMGSMELSSHFTSARDAAAFVDREGVAHAAIVRHTIY